MTEDNKEAITKNDEIKKAPSLERAKHKSKVSLICLLASMPFALILFLSSFLSFLPRLSEIISPELLSQIESFMPYASTSTLVSATAMILLQFPIFRYGLANLFHGYPNTNSLISLSTLGAFVYSVAAILLTDPDLFIGLPSTWFTPFALTLLLAGFGRHVEARARVNSLIASEKSNALSNDERPFISPRESTISGHAAVFAMTISVIVGTIWFAIDGISTGASIFLAVLIACCPASVALVEAPLTWLVIEKAKDIGIIIRSQPAIDTAASVDKIVLGKSGVLTMGQPRITDIVPEGITTGTFLGLAAAAESDSIHPYAKAIKERASIQRARKPRVAAFTEIPGVGVETMSNGRAIRVGQADWIKAQKVYVSADILTKADQLAERGKSVVVVSNGNEAKGLIAFEDDIAPDAMKTISDIKALGIEPVMLTGDTLRTAKSIAKKIGINEVIKANGNDEKSKAIASLKDKGYVVVLYDNTSVNQDGSDLFIASSSSDQKSRENAPIYFSVDDISSLTAVLRLCRNAVNAIKQNFIWTFFGALLAVLAAVGILYVFGGPLLSPSMALASSIPGFIASIVNTIRYAKS